MTGLIALHSHFPVADVKENGTKQNAGSDVQGGALATSWGSDTVRFIFNNLGNNNKNATITSSILI